MPFERILRELSAASGASGAAMVDHEGEIVATAGDDGSADLALIGAHHAVIMDHVKEASSRLDFPGMKRSEEPVDCITVSTQSARLVVKQIKEGYFILLVMDKGVNAAQAIYLAEKSAEKIKEEMG